VNASCAHIISYGAGRLLPVIMGAYLTESGVIQPKLFILQDGKSN
jgi:hypothetical protein